MELSSGFSPRRAGRLLYIGLFVVLQYGTDLFAQYPPLGWVAVAGLVVVFFDAVICARRSWRAVEAELDDDHATQ